MGLAETIQSPQFMGKCLIYALAAVHVEFGRFDFSGYPAESGVGCDTRESVPSAWCPVRSGGTISGVVIHLRV
jgi:hypothetical protein